MPHWEREKEVICMIHIWILNFAAKQMKSQNDLIDSDDYPFNQIVSDFYRFDVYYKIWPD